MDISAETKIKAAIQPGSVYYFPSELLHGSVEPLYFVVINIDPLNEEKLLLVCASSQVDRTLRINNSRLDTNILVTPNDYSTLSCRSVFNCNDVFPYTIDEIVSRLSDGILKIKPEISPGIVQKLRQAAIGSHLIPIRYRKQLGLVM